MVRTLKHLMSAALLLIAGAGYAEELKLPEPQSGLLVLPKGIERKAFPGHTRLGGSFKSETVVGMSWDDEGLMAVMDCTDSSVVAAQGAGRDNPNAWKDDSVELLLDPGHSHGVPLLIRVSAANGVWDSRGADLGFQVAGLVSRVVRTSQGWRATILMPWKGLGVQAPAAGEIWGLNIRRTDQTDPFSLESMSIGTWLPCKVDCQDVMLSGHVGFMLPETLTDPARLAAMRESVATKHAGAIRAWVGANEGDVMTLGEGAVTIPRLGLIGSGAPARQATQVTVSRDAEGLDFRFDCDDADITAAQEGRDNVKLWKDDCVYVWLDIGHRHVADAGMVMVQVSAAGVVHDMKNGDPKWDLVGLVAETKRTEKGWSAHLRLPWQGLGVAAPKDGEVWGVNLTRMDQPGKYDYANMEMSSLAIIPGGDAAAIQRWGHLAFGKTGDLALSPAHVARRAAVDARLAGDAAQAKAELERLALSKGLPANPNASADVHKLVAWFASLPERKEKRFIIGQASGGKNFESEMEKIHTASGKWPAMAHLSFADPASTFEFQNDPQPNETTTSLAIKYWQAGGLIHIHINPVNPWNDRHIFEPNPLEGRERIAEVLQPGTRANLAWMKKLDLYAKCLGQLRDAGVVVLWRPLHEMGLNNMYWYDAGATKDREVFKNIWRHMFRYFTDEKKLDNLIWVFGAGGPTPFLELYPGAAYVDIVGFSQYSAEVNVPNNEYEHLTRLGKPFAFAEFGNWRGSTPGDALDLIRGVQENYPLTTFAVYWGSWPGAPASFGDSLNVTQAMKHPWVISRDDLDWRGVMVGLEKSQARPPPTGTESGHK